MGCLTRSQLRRIEDRLLELTNDSNYYSHVCDVLQESNVSLVTRFTMLRNLRLSCNNARHNTWLTILLWNHYAEEFDLPRLPEDTLIEILSKTPSNADFRYKIDRILSNLEVSKEPEGLFLGALVKTKGLKPGDVVKCVISAKSATIFEIGGDYHLVRSKLTGYPAVQVGGRTYSDTLCSRFIHVPNIPEYNGNPCQEITLSNSNETINGEQTMNTLSKYKDTLVTKVTLVNGIDVTEFTEQDFLSKIRQIQNDIKGYEGLPESKHVSAKVKQLEDDLSTIVKLMDSELSAKRK